MRIILMTGKGGVGKTSVAAATAVGAAEAGHTVLLASTDAAHSLSDIVQTPVGPAPTTVAKNLWAVEIDTITELRTRWEPIRRELADFLHYLGYRDPILAEEIAVMPGMEEVFSLSRLCELAEEGTWDTIVVDCAPTGSTLRLLTFSDTASSRYRRVMHLAGLLFSLAKPGAQVLGVGSAVPSREHLSSVGRMMDEIARLHEMLVRPEQASVRLVLQLEQAVIAETQRTFTFMSLFGFSVDAVVVNRVIPPAVPLGYLEKWREAQQRHYVVVRQSFLDSPMLEIPYYECEPTGPQRLMRLSRDAYGSTDPAAVLSRSRAVTTRHEEQGGLPLDVLEIPLPGISVSDVDVRREGRNLVIDAGDARRVLALPDGLATRHVHATRLAEGVLSVAFS